MSAIALGLLFVVLQSEIDWQPSFSLSCAQIKLEGKRLKHIAFAVYKAKDKSSKCCDKQQSVYTGRTSFFGHFSVAPKLDAGNYYYLVFDAEKRKVIVPIEVKNNYKQKNCTERDFIINAKSDGTVKAETFVTVC